MGGYLWGGDGGVRVGWGGVGWGGAGRGGARWGCGEGSHAEAGGTDIEFSEESRYGTISDL